MGRTLDAAARLTEALDRLEATLTTPPAPARPGMAARLDALEAAVDDALAHLAPYLDDPETPN